MTNVYLPRNGSDVTIIQSNPVLYNIVVYKDPNITLQLCHKQLIDLISVMAKQEFSCVERIYISTQSLDNHRKGCNQNLLRVERICLSTLQHARQTCYINLSRVSSCDTVTFSHQRIEATQYFQPPKDPSRPRPSAIIESKPPKTFSYERIKA